MNELFNLSLECPKLYGYSMFYSNVSLIEFLKIKNISSEDISSFEMEITSRPEIFSPFKMKFKGLAPNEDVVISSPKLNIEGAKIAYIESVTPIVISLKIYINSNCVSVINEGVQLLPYNVWSGCDNMPEILAAFSTPYQPEVISLVEKVISIWENRFKRTYTKGYTNKSKADVLNLFEIVYDLVKDIKITYNITTLSFEKGPSKVFLCEELIRSKNGNSFDISLLVSSILEGLGLNPVITLLSKKVIVGVFLKNEHFNVQIVDGVNSFLSTYEAERLIFIEPSSLVNGTSVNFENSIKMVASSFEKSDNYILSVDINKARKVNVSFLPNRVWNENEFYFEEVKQSGEELLYNKNVYSDDSELNPILTLKNLRKSILDLSSSNPLLNFNDAEFLTLKGDSFKELSDAFKFEQPVYISPKLDSTNSESKIDGIYSFLSENELLEKINTIININSADIYSSLYLGFGLLKWTMPDNKMVYKSPILLMSVDIIKNTDRNVYIVSLKKDIFFNKVLFEKLNYTFGIDLFSLSDRQITDIDSFYSTFNELENQLSIIDGFSVFKENVFLFSANHFAYNLYNAFSEEQLNNVLFEALITNDKLKFKCDNSSLNFDKISPMELPVMFDLDASQLTALRSALNDEYSIINGYSGSGKTLLASNIIFDVLFSGKNVLYLASNEKKCSDLISHLQSLGLEDEYFVFKSKKPTPFFDIELHNSISFSPELYSLCEKYKSFSMKDNEYYRALEEYRQYGFSLYSAILQYDTYKYAKNIVCFSPIILKDLDKEDISYWFSVIGDLIKAGLDTGGPFNNPLRFIKLKNFSYEIKAKAVTLLDEYISSTSLFIEAHSEALKNIFDIKLLTLEQAAALRKLYSFLIEKNNIPASYFDKNNSFVDRSALEAVIECGINRQKLASKLSENFTEEIFKLPAAELADEWRNIKISSIFKNASQKKIKSKLTSCLKNKKSISNDDVLDILLTVDKLNEYDEYINKNIDIINELFAIDVKAPGNNNEFVWNDIREVFKNCNIICDLLDIIRAEQCDNTRLNLQFISDIAHDKLSLEKIYNDIVFSNKKYSEAEAEFSKFVSYDIKSQLDIHEKDWFEYLPQEQKRLFDNIDGLKQWIIWLKAKDAALDVGFYPLIKEYEDGNVSSEELKDVFLKYFFKSVCENIMTKEQVLSMFSAEEHIEDGELCKEYRDKLIELQKNEIKTKLNSNFESYVSSLNISEIDKIKKHKNLHVTPKLFKEFLPVFTKRYKCFIGTSLSAFEYVIENNLMFDYIIFDDAHLMPFSKFIPFVTHANKLCFIGSNVFSDTTFENIPYRNSVINEKNKEPNLFNAILKLNIPVNDLIWNHRNTTPIASFVNNVFANNGYNKPFPLLMPDSIEVPKVKHIQTGGKYDSDKSKTNVVEATAVVDEVIKICEENINKEHLSIGIYTVNSYQKKLIETLLLKKLNANPDIVDFLSYAAEEPIFVRNIFEDGFKVRDILLLSLTVAVSDKTRVGRKISEEAQVVSGEDSFEKLVTSSLCARKQLYIFSSFAHSDLKRSFSKMPGYKGFYAYCKELFKIIEAQSKTSYFNPGSKVNQIALKIAEFLKLHGYKTKLGYGVGDFRIDIAVSLAGEEDNYSFAILLDDTIYKNSNSFINRETFINNLLQSKGWEVHRVYSIDWFENYQNQLELILSRLNDKNKMQLIKTEEPIETVIEKLI